MSVSFSGAWSDEATACPGHTDGGGAHRVADHLVAGDAMKHRAPQAKKKIMTVLLDAGLVVIVLMGAAVIALAVAVAFATGMLG